ncbi:MAG TPA: divergent PAP2 family protein [Anaerovoracaceae bacterium]|nr:divergent PAP2 family protein [Anaerovoracaceae bacterium]
MNIFSSIIFANDVLWTVVSAWLTASFLKVVFYAIQKKKINLRRLIGNGGMPSTHSASVVSLAIAVGFKEGWNSTALAIALILAFIVMIDASGVRLAASKHAKALNEITEEVFKDGQFHYEKFNELLGHTPTQVFVGGLIGVIVSVIFYHFIW